MKRKQTGCNKTRKIAIYQLGLNHKGKKKHNNRWSKFIKQQNN